MRTVIAIVLMLGTVGFAAADGLQEGQKEAGFRFSWSDTDLGSSGGFDLGSSEELNLSGSYGWMLTDNHEVGVLVSYFSQDIDAGDLGADSDTDGTGLGGFYHYNFSTSGNVTPFFGVNIATLGGDLGDAFDMQYGAEAGIKLYPFKHAGFVASVAYNSLSADSSLLDDATSISVGAGLLVKYSEPGA